jgi:hypothetical protein
MITNLKNNFKEVMDKYKEETLSPNTNYFLFIRTLMSNLKENSDVSQVINAIQNLHQLLIKEQHIFVHVFENVYDEFKKFLFNENPEIVKESLNLVCDLFSTSWFNPEIINWII